MAKPLKPSIEEINYFAAATVVVAFALITFRSSYDLRSVLFYILASGFILLSREIGQRVIAEWMEAEVELELSMEGTGVTLFGALISAVTSLPGLFLFPVSSSFSVKSYEHWGKSVDAMWLKREHWLISGGLLGMSAGWLSMYLFGFYDGAAVFSYFMIFQLLPFDYSKIPTGRLDGAVVLKHNGFQWLIWFALAWISLAVVTL